MTPARPWISAVLVLASAAVVFGASARSPVPAPASPEAGMAFDDLAGAVWVTPSATATASSRPIGPPVDPEAEESGCAIGDRGMGDYGEPITMSKGTVIVPKGLSGHYDLVVHLHGGGAAQRVVAPANLGVVLATVDAGVGSRAYASAFAEADVFTTLLEEVGRAAAPARLRYLVISSWSAGYGGVRQILRQAPASVDALVLLDSVHASYDGHGEVDPAGLAPFLRFAERARSGETTMVLTHSEIRPPGYASTSEVADHLLGEIAGQRHYAGMVPFYGVELKTTYDEDGFHVRGFTGAGKDAHCAHVRMLPDLLRTEVLPTFAATP